MTVTATLGVLPAGATTSLATTVVSAFVTVSMKVVLESNSLSLWAKSTVTVYVPASRVTAVRARVAVPSDWTAAVPSVVAPTEKVTSPPGLAAPCTVAVSDAAEP